MREAEQFERDNMMKIVSKILYSSSVSLDQLLQSPVNITQGEMCVNSKKPHCFSLNLHA